MEATTRCFLELVKREIFTKEELDVPADYFREFGEHNPKPIQLIGLKHINLKAASDEIRAKLKQLEAEKTTVSTEKQELLSQAEFAHLHNHTQFSVLQSTISIPELIAATAKIKCVPLRLPIRLRERENPI